MTRPVSVRDQTVYVHYVPNIAGVSALPVEHSVIVLFVKGADLPGNTEKRY